MDSDEETLEETVEGTCPGGGAADGGAGGAEVEGGRGVLVGAGEDGEGGGEERWAREGRAGPPAAHDISGLMQRPRCRRRARGGV